MSYLCVTKGERNSEKILKIRFGRFIFFSYLCVTNKQSKLLLMSKFDRSKIKEIHKDVNDALALIAKKHGMSSLSTGTLRFDETNFRVTVTGIAGLDAFMNNNKPIETLSLSDLVNPRTLIGKTFIATNGNKFTVVDYKANRPKYPIVASNAAGTLYKFTVESVKRGLTK